MVYPCLLLIAIFSIVLDFSMRISNKRLCPWYFKLPKVNSPITRLRARFFGGGLRLLGTEGGGFHGN